jgi:hypothetical protein
MRLKLMNIMVSNYFGAAAYQTVAGDGETTCSLNKTETKRKSQSIPQNILVGVCI